MLYHRRDQIDEEQRLGAQHKIVKHAVFGGRLIFSSVPANESMNAVADVGCGTGLWLNDLARTHFGDRLHSNPPMLVGFDVNAKAFTKSPERGVQLVEHDCTKPFDERYYDRFDLVNMRALAYAVPEEGFYSLIKNVLRLLRPGGYLQWGESGSKLWKAIPVDSESSPAEEHSDLATIERSLEIVDEERSTPGLVTYLPNFMVRSLMRLPPLQSVSALAQGYDPVSIIHFEIRPGGASAISNDRLEPQWVDVFSKLTFEALKLLLNAALIRKQKLMERPVSQTALSGTPSDSVKEIERLQGNITELISGGKVRMGGVFPARVARKAKPY